MRLKSLHLRRRPGRAPGASDFLSYAKVMNSTQTRQLVQGYHACGGPQDSAPWPPITDTSVGERSSIVSKWPQQPFQSRKLGLWAPTWVQRLLHWACSTAFAGALAGSWSSQDLAYTEGTGVTGGSLLDQTSGTHVEHVVSPQRPGSSAQGS